jgi:uncharacterized protein (DUF1800 family)
MKHDNPHVPAPAAQLDTPTPTLTPTLTPTVTATATLTATAPAPTMTTVPTSTPEPGQPAAPPLEVIVYNRLAYGPRAGDLDSFRALPGATPDDKLNSWLDQQLNPRGISDNDCTSRVQAHALPTQKFADSTASLPALPAAPGNPPTGSTKVHLPLISNGALPDANATLAEHWINYRRRPNRGNAYPEWRPAKDVEISTLLRAVYSQRQLYEVMVEFWHNHFSIYAWEGYALVTWQHYDTFVIRRNALGNFRNFLEDVATSPAMLYYLDNYLNTRAGPNENWARELFELHGLGAEHYAGTITQSAVPGYPNAPEKYVDEDVYESTRCFTGWAVHDAWGSDSNPSSWGNGTFIFEDGNHDRFQKFVLGTPFPPDQPPMADGRRVLDLIANHPGTARYIARRMCRRLIGDNVDDDTVQVVADVFYNNRTASDQIAMTVRAIATSAAFKTTWAQKVKRPWEAAVHGLRATNAQLNLKPTLVNHPQYGIYWDDENDLYWNYESMGMPLFGRRPPDGWPDKRIDWSGTTGMLFRWKFMYWIAAAGTASNRTDIRTDFVGPTNAGVPLRTAANVVDFWINRILGYPMAPSSRQELIDFILGQDITTLNLSDNKHREVLAYMISLILSSPEFNWR